MIGTCRGIALALLFSVVACTLFAAAPVHYIENKNQWPAGIRFGADFPQIKVLLKDASIYFIQYSQITSDTKTPKKLQTQAASDHHVHSSGETAIATFELTFLDALQASISASEKKKTKYNYFYGSESSSWASNASAYGEVLYSGMYEGIDLRMYSEGDQMKYDWIVSPCADVRKIRFSYKGAEHVEIRDENLVIESKLGEVVETKPYAYQIVNGERRAVAAAFEIDDGVVSFIFPQGYDTNYELVIDPFLIFSSYSGSTLDNWGNTATPDSRGNLYSGGMVLGPVAGESFPTTPGAYQTVHHGGAWDLGILKYDSVGANVLYVTYLGGNGTETPQSLVVNSNDELLILGATSSTNFPGTAGGFKGGEEVDPLGGVEYEGGTDLFIARLSVDGSHLLGATYLGGSGNDGIGFVSGDMEESVRKESPLARNYGDQLRGDIITTPDGSVYIASNTMSADFPIVNSDATVAWHGGTHDAIVAKLNSSLSLEWSRFIGGDSTDAAYSIKITQTGNILVAGGTVSANIAGMNGLIVTAPKGIDGWIAELSASGDQVINATYVGTPRYDQVYFIDIATNGDVLAYGQTQGEYPITSGVYQRASSGQFLHRYTPDLKTTIFSTTFGKGNLNPDISPTAFLVNACDNIYMAGWGGTINSRLRSPNYMGGNTRGLPVTSDAWQTTSQGNDFYMMVLTGDARELVYATFLGGTTSPTHVDGGTSRFDKRGVVYHAVCAGCGGRPNDFPSYHVPSERSQNRSTNCNNAAFKFDLSSLRAGLQTNNVALTAPGFNRVCLPDGVIFQNIGVGGEIFEWDFGDGVKTSALNKNNIFHAYKKPGKYTVELKSIDHSTCIGKDSVTTVIDVFLPNMGIAPDQDICYGSSTHITGFGGSTYQWRTLDNSSVFTGESPLIVPTDTTTYYVTITDINGCMRKDTVTVNVVPIVDLKFDIERIYDCQTRPYIKLTNVSELKEGEEAMFLFGDGSSSDEKEVIHTYERDDIYTISLQATKEFCVYEHSRSLPVVTLKVPNVITPGAEDGLNDAFRLVYGDPELPKNGLTVQLKIVNRWGVKVFESNDYKDDWRGADLDAGVYFFEIELGEFKCKGWIHLIK